MGLVRDAYLVLGFSESCPECGSPWERRDELVGKTAVDFDSCAFRCLACGIGLSKAATPRARVPITSTPELNIPPQARPGVDTGLAGAINVHNRRVKHQKFCSARSEDAVTWTVIAGLREAAGLGALIGQPQLGPPNALLLWGCPIEGVRAPRVHGALVRVSDGLWEKSVRRSEPDGSCCGPACSCSWRPSTEAATTVNRGTAATTPI